MNAETKRKYDLFVDLYIRSFNATQCAIKVGYSEKTAGTQGARLLKNVYVKEKLDVELSRLRERMMEEGSQSFSALLNTLVDIDKKLRLHIESESQLYLKIKERNKAMLEADKQRVEVAKLERIKNSIDGRVSRKKEKKKEAALEYELSKKVLFDLEYNVKSLQLDVDLLRRRILWPKDWERVQSLKVSILQDILDRGGFKQTDKVSIDGDMSLKVVIDYGE